MNTAQEPIREAGNAVSDMGDDLDEMGDFISLICVLLTAPDLEDQCPGLHRLVLVIRKHLHNVRDQHIKASRAISELARP